MTAILKRALKQGHTRDAVLLDIDHPSGQAYFWDGLGMLDYNGHTYVGVGTLGSIQSIIESLEPEIIESSFTVSGLDTTFVEGLNSNVKNRSAQVYDVILNDQYHVVDAELALDVVLDYQTFAFENDGSVSITINAHAGLFFLRNRSAAKWSPEQMKYLFPDESGFDEIYLVENQVDDWGPVP